MSNVFKFTLSVLSTSVFVFGLSERQSFAETNALKAPEQIALTSELAVGLNQSKWQERIASIRAKREQRLIKLRERKAAAEERRKAAMEKLAAKKSENKASTKTKSAKKVAKKATTKSDSKTTDKNGVSLRVGWAKVEGKFVYRSARVIKVEQEAAEAKRKAIAAKKVAAAKKKSSRRTARLNTKAKGSYGKLIAKYAAQNGVPYRLARAVVFVESSFRPNVTGGVGEIGLMQIRLSTARGMGYKGSAKQLYNPATNLYWGMKYLGKAHRLAGGSTCGTILKYNAGHGAKRMNPISQRYCNRIRKII